MTKIEGQFLVSGSGLVVSDGTQEAVVRSLVAGTGLSIANGNGVAGNPSYALANTAVTAASYGDGTHVGSFTVDAQGRLSAASAVAITFPVSSVFGRTGAVVAAASDYAFSQISGSVAASQLPSPTSSTLGGVKSLAAVSHNFLTSISTAGLPVAAQPATADLSDYATGTWTPADASGAGLTFTVQTTGAYTRIGNMVFAYAYIGWPVTANGSAAAISGLPFATANSRYAQQGKISASQVTSLAYARPRQNSQTFDLLTNALGTISNVTMSNSDLYVEFIYPIA